MFSQECFPLLLPLVFTSKKPVFYFLPAFCSVYFLHSVQFLPAEEVAALLDQHWQTFITRYSQFCFDQNYMMHVLLFSLIISV